LDRAPDLDTVSSRDRPLPPRDESPAETTLDPDVRSLYQIRIEHADEAGEIFQSLMGDVVEPRREFIQDNALKVVNLNV
jgi:DNA gyrase/topoisomerase IV subunit B